MIKEMRNQYRRMTRPVKKADGGDMDWGDLENQLSGVPKIAPVTSTVAPLGVNKPDTSGIPGPPSNVKPIDTSGAPRPEPGTNWGAIAGNVAPYISNIANEFRRPPQPMAPHLDNMVTIGSPNYNNDRAEASREIEGNSVIAGRNVDGNTAARIRLFNQGQKLEKLSSINQQDNNMKLQARNDQARINASISGRNNDKLDNYDNQQVERGVAIQREQSANLSNATDKFVSINNEQQKRQVDLDKTRTMATLFSRSGVGDRERKALRDSGVPDPLGKNYADIKRNGGIMRMGGSFYRGVPLRSQTLRSTYKPAN